MNRARNLFMLLGNKTFHSEISRDIKRITNSGPFSPVESDPRYFPVGRTRCTQPPAGRRRGGREGCAQGSADPPRNHLSKRTNRAGSPPRRTLFTLNYQFLEFAFFMEETANVRDQRKAANGVCGKGASFCTCHLQHMRLPEIKEQCGLQVVARERVGGRLELLILHRYILERKERICTFSEQFSQMHARICVQPKVYGKMFFP